jgi:hypothetical protein
MDAAVEWAPLLRAARAEVREKLNYADREDWEDSSERIREEARMLSLIARRNGCDAASDRMSALAEAIDPLADAIVAAEASTLAGLRAKALVVMWEARPSFAHHHGALEFPDDAYCGRVSTRWLC